MGDGVVLDAELPRQEGIEIRHIPNVARVHTLRVHTLKE